jgi:transcriptional regulator with XRE-family HTH domain
MKVHEKIRFLRSSKNWSQEEMAEKLGMTVSGYAKIEQGRTDAHFSKLEQIADVFDMDVVELLSLGAKNIVFLIGDNSNGIGNSSISMSVIGSSKDLAFEIQKLQLIIEHHEDTIEQYKIMMVQKDKEILYLRGLVDSFMKKENL